LRDLGKYCYQPLRRPGWGKGDDAGKTPTPGAECEGCDTTLAHAGDNDGACAAAGQPRDRRFELSQAVEERPVAPAPI